MVMKLMEWIRKVTGSKNYSLSKDLRNTYGIEISVPGIDGYDKDTAKSMRLDVLCGFRALSGKSWEDFGKRLDDEFLPKPKK